MGNKTTCYLSVTRYVRTFLHLPHLPWISKMLSTIEDFSMENMLATLLKASAWSVFNLYFSMYCLDKSSQISNIETSNQINKLDIKYTTRYQIYKLDTKCKTRYQIYKLDTKYVTRYQIYTRCTNILQQKFKLTLLLYSSRLDVFQLKQFQENFCLGKLFHS